MLLHSKWKIPHSWIEAGKREKILAEAAALNGHLRGLSRTLGSIAYGATQNIPSIGALSALSKALMTWGCEQATAGEFTWTS